MLILFILFTLYIAWYFVKLAISPALRKTKDRATWIALTLFMFSDILSIWNCSAMIQGDFKNCLENFQARYVIQVVFMVGAGSILVLSYNNACLQVYNYSVNGTLLAVN